MQSKDRSWISLIKKTEKERKKKTKLKNIDEMPKKRKEKKLIEAGIV